MSNAGRKRRVTESISRNTNIRFSDAELLEIDENANLAGMTRSEYIRRRVLGRPVKAKPGVMDAQAINQLRAIGNNLNQAVRKLNISGRDDLLTEAVEMVREALVKLLDRMEQPSDD